MRRIIKKRCYICVMLIALLFMGVVASEMEVLASVFELKETEINRYGEPDLVISNAREFSEFANNISNGNDYSGKLIVLSADIVYDGVSVNNYIPASGSFKGILDGMGHSISGIDVTDKSYAALFKEVSSSGIVKNVTLSNSSFQGDSYVSGIAAVNNGVIENCVVTGCKLNTKGNYGQCLGGVAGYSGGTIRNCYTYNTTLVNGGIYNYTYVGGIVGELEGNIFNCCNQASISSGGGYVGGIAGIVRQSSSIENCYNTGKLTKTGNGGGYVGGIAGFVSNGIVAHCYTSTASSPMNFGSMNGTERDNKAYSEADMKAATFLNLLNTNRGSHTDWAIWEIRSESAYPLPVKAKDITKCTATLSAVKTSYNFEEQKPTVKVTDNGATLNEGMDYNIIYPEDMTKPGTKTIIVDSAGTYYGRIELTYTIEKAEQQLLCATAYSKKYNESSFSLGVKHSLGNGEVTYTSSNQKAATVNGNGYVSPVGIGKTIITVNAAETEYFKASSVQISVTIKPVKVNVYSAFKKNGKISLYWTRDYKAKGYEVQYSTDKKFKKDVTKVIVKKSKKTSYKSKKVKRGKSYYVRVRAYKGNVYGAWSKAIKVK